MNTRESLKGFLQLPEMSAVGGAAERAAFIAIHIEGRTVRDAAQAIGVGKSQVTNLATLFQTKLATRIIDLERKRLPVSKEYLELRGALLNQLRSLQEESGSETGFGLGDSRLSREDLAECFGTPLGDLDE